MSKPRDIFNRKQAALIIFPSLLVISYISRHTLTFQDLSCKVLHYYYIQNMNFMDHFMSI